MATLPNGTTRSLGDTLFDPIWARLAEASIPVAFHLGDSGYEGRMAAASGASGQFEGFGTLDVLSRVLVSDRAIHDTVATLIVHGVFQRHPRLRVASIENGSDWTHGEGVAQPLDFEKELRGFDERAVKRIMHDNCVELLRG